jgi:hypothetical protein
MNFEDLINELSESKYLHTNIAATFSFSYNFGNGNIYVQFTYLSDFLFLVIFLKYVLLLRMYSREQ